MSADDTASARVVLEAPDGTHWGASDWDPSGERLLVLNYVSIADSRIHLLDLRTGRHQRILGDPRRPASYFPAAFDREGRGIFLTTHQGGEFTQLAYQPLPRGRLEILTADIPWNVEGVVMSEDRSRAAFTVNEGGISRLYLLDPATRQFRRVEAVPQGIVSGGGFSPDGRQFAFTLNSAAGPSDVYALALGDDPLGHGELTRWTFSEVGGLNPESFVTPELIDT